MPTVQEICDFLEAYAPLRLAEEWDNVGLLVGDAARPVGRMMTCLTVTPSTVDEAVAKRAEMIVTHHPFPFRPLSRITADDTVGHMLLRLVEASGALYSPHTAFDSAGRGINQRLAEGLQLQNIRPLTPLPDDPDSLGSGRYGDLTESLSLSELGEIVKRMLSVPGLHIVGQPDRRIDRVAVGCGSAGQFLDAARSAGCQLLVTGETGFHTCLAAAAADVSLLLPGHYASERFAIEALAADIQRHFPAAQIWASTDESDPLAWM